MWPGEQPPGGEQNAKHPQNAGVGGQPNPYQQPGYQQQNPYAQQQPPAPWNAPTVTAGAPVPPPGDGGRRTKIVAITAAAAVVIAAGVTGYAVLGGGKDDGADPEPTKSASQQSSPTSNPRRSDGDVKPTIAGWKTVLNPDRGIAFDVPAEWALRSTGWVTYVSKEDDPQDKPLIAMKAPAILKEKWCGSDEDKNGSTDYTELADAGTRGNDGAKSPEDAAREDARTWVYGAYTQPDKKLVKSAAVKSYTTNSGIKGALATASSSGVKKQQKCDSDGKATTFAFKNPSGDIVSWSFVGAKGVSEEVPDTTVQKILGTIRLYDVPSDS
ncbi:hypothetical protein [Streptomyces sp. SAS_270]|uniref:hypothetical protein n=1 Tax=Streptomyces sp. SAS_270 TaxID=3412748 RepID=UPI00403CA4BA